MIKIIFVVLLMLCSIDNIIAKDKLQKISVQLNGKYQFEFAGFIAAKEKGFYKEEGLDVTLKEYLFGMNIVDEVLENKATFGIHNSTILSSYLKGKPIVLVASIFKRSALVIVTKANIKTLDELKGKTLMATNADMRELRFMFKSQKINIDDIHIQPHTFNINEFINGSVDAISIYKFDQLDKLDKLGIKYNVFDPSDYGVYALQSELFTKQPKTIKQINTINRFKRATIQGWEYALSHKEELINLIYTKYSQSLTKDELKNEANIIEKLILPNSYKIGSIDKKFLEKQFELYIKDMHMQTNRTLQNFIEFDSRKTKIAISLTKEEKQYIHKKKILTVCTNPNWTPIEFLEDNKPQGISIDTLEILANNLNLQLKYIPTKSWTQSQQFLEQKKCDILPSAVKTAKRLKYANFTKPYLEYDLAIITQHDKPLVSNLQSVINKSMVRKKGSGLISKLKQKYPNIQITTTKGYQESFEKVANSDVYFTIATLPVLSYYKNKLQLENLQIAGYTKMKYKLCIAVRKDDIMLLHILDKELSKIDTNTKNLIYEKWTKKQIEFQTDYSLLWKIGIVSLLIIIIILYFNAKQTKLNKQIKQLNLKLEKKVQDAILETQKKEQLLQQQSRLAQMGEMINMIAHQWRQPLSAISSTSASLKLKVKLNKLDSDTVMSLADKILNYSQHLSTTIDDFRDFFQKNKGTHKVTYAQVITQVLNIIEASISNKNIQIIKKYDSIVIFDTYSNELKQVILNLIKNAEDALIDSQVENPTITIETNGYILEISDNAGGVPDDIIKNIFDPYFSTKTKKDGTGLGLYMSKTIIEEHCEGTLSVKNKNGGAVFRIVLPQKIKLKQHTVSEDKND